MSETLLSLLKKKKDDVHSDVRKFLDKNDHLFVETVHIHRAALDSNLSFDELVNRYVQCVKRLSLGDFSTTL